MYYRVATRTNQAPEWKWKSTVLTSLQALFGFLRMYNHVPEDSIRVFFSSSVEYMNEMLARENSGLASNSVTARQFLNGKRISSGEMAHLESELGGESEPGRRPTGTLVLADDATKQSPVEKTPGGQLSRETSMSSLDMKRLELEMGAGGDHDTPYTFSLPVSMPQVLAWMRLLSKVQLGELEL